MKRLFFIQSIILLSLSSSSFASSLRQDLREAVDRLDSDNCARKMRGTSLLLDGLSADDYKKELSSSGHELLLDELWNYKIIIHEKMRELGRTLRLNRDCADSMRHAFRSIRTSEDYIQESFYRLNSDSLDVPDDAFGEGNKEVKKHPDMQNFRMVKDLKSGDIILSRGNAFTSAAIASLGEFDTQFSHMSIVYRDKDAKLWTVEAHIEVGSFVRPLEDHIADKNARTMILRYEDEETAQRAAEFIFNKVKKASDTTGNILYDFGFNQEDSEQLFCSEVISHAFDVATEGSIQIPFFKSQLMSRKPEFVKMLGITASASFVPADIEVDPRFKVLAEWRDSKKVNELLQKDAILHAMYHWNDSFNYQMIQASSSKSIIYRNVAWPLRRVPFLKKYFVEKMPLNMSRQLIGYFGVLESVGEYLQQELKAADNEAIERNSLPLMAEEKYRVLDQLRMLDLQNKGKLHKMYRPTQGK